MDHKETEPQFIKRVLSSAPEEAIFANTGSFGESTIMSLKVDRLMHILSSKKSLSPDGGETWTSTESLRDDKGNEIKGMNYSLVRLNSGNIAVENFAAGGIHPAADFKVEPGFV